MENHGICWGKELKGLCRFDLLGLGDVEPVIFDILDGFSTKISMVQRLSCPYCNECTSEGFFPWTIPASIALPRLARPAQICSVVRGTQITSKNPYEIYWRHTDDVLEKRLQLFWERTEFKYNIYPNRVANKFQGLCTWTRGTDKEVAKDSWQSCLLAGVFYSWCCAPGLWTWTQTACQGK